MKAYFDHENVDVLGRITARCGFDRVARASRARVIASSQSRTFPVFTHSHKTMAYVEKDCFGATPKPARETRALHARAREEKE